MNTIHEHVIGIDKALRKTPLYKCPACIPNKMSKRSHERTSKHKKRKTKPNMTTESSEDIPDLFQDDPENIESDLNSESVPGQHFHMDFGFVRGSEYKVKGENQPTITSIDGYNSYLIIVDRVSRYIWIFLTSSKAPPISIARRVLNKFKCKNPHRTVRTDQGGELGMSEDFQEMVDDENFVLEVTGADASAQNAMS